MTNIIGKQEQRATLKKKSIENVNPCHQLDFITVCRINNECRQSIPDSNPSERNATMEKYKIKPCLLSFCTTAPILRQQSYFPYRQAYKEKNTSHTPSHILATARATVLTPLVKHINPFYCLLDEDNDKAPIVKFSLVSTTCDEFSGTNGDAFYISTNLDQQQ